MKDAIRNWLAGVLERWAARLRRVPQSGTQGGGGPGPLPK